MLRVLGWLPRPLRRRLLLARVRIDTDALADVSISVVSDRAQAASLLHDAYVERGFIAPNRERLYRDAAFENPATVTFLATRGSEPVGTVSLLIDSPGGLSCERTHAAEVRGLRQAGRRCGEVGKLTVTAPFRHLGLNFLLYRAVYKAALRRQLDCVLARTTPFAMAFYEDLMLFERIGRTRRDAHRCGSAFALGALDLGTCRQRALERFAGDERHWTPLRIFCSDALARFDATEDLASLDGSGRKGRHDATPDGAALAGGRAALALAVSSV
jgi:hypothetical protein